MGRTDRPLMESGTEADMTEQDGTDLFFKDPQPCTEEDLYMTEEMQKIAPILGGFLTWTTETKDEVRIICVIHEHARQNFREHRLPQLNSFLQYQGAKGNWIGWSYEYVSESSRSVRILEILPQDLWEIHDSLQILQTIEDQAGRTRPQAPPQSSSEGPDETEGASSSSTGDAGDQTPST